ncbi:MAG: protein kinase [Phycisphaerae bacterium]|nr:protein kinase [Phycisphaerae bacterium]
MSSPAAQFHESVERARRALDLFVELADVSATDRAIRIAELAQDDPALAREVDAMFAADSTGAGAALTPGAGMAQILAGGGLTAAGERAAPRTPAPMAHTPTLAGRYRLLRVIGEGGMGTVYEAEQASPRRLVALKALRGGTGASERLAQRFALEAEVLARLQHPGIAQVYEAGFEDEDAAGPAWIAMELVRGRPLVEAAREGNIARRDRLALYVRICEAVAYAHQRGVIHRDLKPANILLGEPDDAAIEAGLPGTPKVLDFGVARVVGDAWDAMTALTSPGQVVGTLSYMSPEQLSGDPEAVDVRSDIYSLGVILYELLGDARPFDVGTCGLAEAIRRIREEPPPPLDKADPSLAGDLAAIVAKAMAKDAKRRYQSAAELAADIRAHIRGEPITARADSALYVLSRRLRRYRWPIALALLALLALVAFAVRAIFEAERFERVATEARNATTTAENAQLALERELAQSRLDQARLYAFEGSVAAASQLAKTEHRNRPSRGTLWALRELVARHPCVATARVPGGQPVGLVPIDHRRVVIPFGDGRLVTYDDRANEIGCTELDGIPRSPSLVDPGTDDEPSFVVVPLTNGSLVRYDLPDVEPRGEFAKATDKPRLSAGRGDRVAIANESGVIEVFNAKGERTYQAKGPLPIVLEWLDDDRLIVGGYDGSLHVHRLADGNIHTWRGHVAQIGSIAVDPSQGLLATSSDDRKIKLWRLDDYAPVASAEGRNGLIRKLAFLPNGDLFSSGWWGNDRWSNALVERHRVATVGEGTGWGGFIDTGMFITAGERLRVWQFEPGGGIPTHGLVGRTACALAPDGKTVVFADGEGSIAVTNAATGDVERWLPRHRARVRAIAFSKDGSLFAAGGDDRELRVYRTSDWSLLGVRGGLDAPSSASVAFSPDGQSIAATFADRSARVMRVDTLTDTAIMPLGPSQALSVAWSSDGEQLATTARDNVLRLWTRDGRPIGAAPRGISLWSAAFSPDGQRIAVGTWHRTIEIYDASTLTLVDTLTGIAGLVTQVHWHPTEPLLLASSADGVLRLWDLDDRRAIFSFEPAGSGDLTGCAIDATGSRFAASGAAGEAFIFDVKRWDEWSGPE